MPTLAGYENHVREYADANNLYLSRADVRRAAKEFVRRGAEFYDLDRDLRNLGFISDPTPAAAVRDILENDQAAARRLGLA